MALVVALWFAVVPVAAQERTRVVLLESKGGSRFSDEILARLRGELSASDVELAVVAAPEGLPPKEAIQSAWPELDPDVVLFVVEQPNAARRTEEIWLSDRLAHRLFVQRVNADPAEPARSPRWVAVQATELVRARMAESRFTLHPNAASPITLPPPLTFRPHEPRATSFNAGIGIGLLHGFHSLADTWIPMGRISVSLFDRALDRTPFALDLRTTVGVGIERGVVYRDQSASLRQSFGVLEVLVRFAPRAALQPLLSIGGGAYVLDVEGNAAAPYRNHSQRTWSALNTVGAGISFTPSAGFAFLLDATFMDVWSRTTVRFGGDDVVRSGAPIALFGAAASAVF